MATSTRIRGKALKLSVDAVDYWCDVTSVVLKNEEADGDVTTFCDAAAGGARQFYFEVEAIQSTDSASFWNYLWENTGDEVPFVFAPHGNTAASTTQPHFTGSLVIGPKPDLGGNANETFTFETRLDVVGTPTKVTA